jgi:hypothetical protein
MPANFYNDSARMFGVDMHHAYLIPLSPGELSKGHLMVPWPYVVHVTLSDSNGDEAKRTSTVTADGERMIRDGFVNHRVIHFTAGPFHPYQNTTENPKIEADSTSTPLLKAPTVTSGGDPLSVCGVWSMGANLNCQEDGAKATGIVVCVCSVQTSPQAKDLIFRLFDDFFKKMLVDWLVSTLDKLLEARKFPSPVRAVIKWLAEKALKKFVDMLEDLSKWAWDRAAEPPKLPREPEYEPLWDPNDPEGFKKWQKREEWREGRKDWFRKHRPSWFPEWYPHPEWYF